MSGVIDYHLQQYPVSSNNMVKYVINWLCKAKAIHSSASPEGKMLNSLVKKGTTHLDVFNGFGVPAPDPSIQRLKDKAKHGDNKLDFDATRELISIVFCLQKHPVHSRNWFRKAKPSNHNWNLTIRDLKDLQHHGNKKKVVMFHVV